MSLDIERLLSTPEGRGLLRAQHTCIRQTSSMQCIACNQGTPYPAATVEELIDGMTKTRSAVSAPGRKPVDEVTKARPTASMSGQPQEGVSGACQKCGYDPSATVTTTISFLINRDPPSMNRRLVNTLVGGRLYRREKQTWMMEIRAARLEHKIPYAYRAKDDRSSWPAVDGKRRVTIERRYGGRQRERDLDNLIGGMKPCVDAMVAERLLVDDAPAHAEIHYLQRRVIANIGLWIAIEILGG